MTKRSLISTLASAAFVATTAGTAQADAVAGWDFSQYFSSGLLTTDGASFTNTLDANYSDFDPTFNAGAESEEFGTMYMDGTNGSSNVNPASASAEFQPISGDLTNNPNPFLGGTGNPFESFTILTDEGQTFANSLSMVANAAVSVVFEADLGSLGGGVNWSLDFSGIVEGGTSAAIGVEVSDDGIDYSTVDSLALTSTDTLFSVPLGTGVNGEENVYVRLNFDPGAGNPQIDHLSISADVVPEPGTALLGLVGIAGLALVGRKRA